MGGSVGKIFNSAVSVLKPLAQTALKAVTPKAISLLQDLTKSGFDGIKNVATSLASRLPGIGQLASKLLGQGMDKLSGLATDGIQKYLTQLLEKLAPRNVPGTSGNVTTPALPDRAAGAGGEINQILEMLKKLFPQAAGGSTSTGSTSSAATGGTSSTSGTSGSSSSSSTGGGKNIEDAVIGGSAFSKLPNEKDFEIKGDEDEVTLAKKQALMQKYARMMQAITAMLQASHEMKKGIIQNFRV